MSAPSIVSSARHRGGDQRHLAAVGRPRRDGNRWRNATLARRPRGLAGRIGGARAERRLHEVYFMWVRQHADVLSVQRLTNLSNHTGTLPQHHPEAIAAIAMQGPNGHRWKKLAGTTPPSTPSSLHLRSAPPLRLTAPSTAMVRLRLAMGVGVKADALTYLLGTHEWRSVQEVTRATGYTKAGVRRSLDELAEARFIESEDGVAWHARGVRNYRADPKIFRTLLGLGSVPQPGGTSASASTSSCTSASR